MLEIVGTAQHSDPTQLSSGYDFQRRCSAFLKTRQQIGAQRIKLRGHPGLSCGQDFVCLDVNHRRLLMANVSKMDRVRNLLSDAPRHRWPFSQPHDQFAYICFVTTNRCNLDCKYCFAGQVTSHTDMDPALARRMARRVSEISDSRRYPGVYFFGGEPTLNMQAVGAVIDELDNLPVDYVPKLLTNGLFGQRTLEFLAERRLVVQFSYDGLGNSLRMTEHQGKRLIENIKRCADYGLPIIIRPAVSSLNVDSLPDFLDEASNLVGENLLSINIGVLNLNKGGGLSLSTALLPSSGSFVRAFEEMVARGRQRRVRISSPVMTHLRNHSVSGSYQPCFIATDGSLASQATYGKGHPSGRGIGFGNFDRANDRFDIDSEALEIMSQNYMENAFLCDQQDCFAQSIWGGYRKSVKFSRQVYPKEHLGFFQADMECASLRDMIEVHIVDLLKVFSHPSEIPSAKILDGIWYADIEPLIESVY